MKAVAVGDLLLPASVFDETIRSASWVTAYDSFDWDVTKKRDELRNVVRRMETGGSRAFLPTQEELERLKDAEVILSHLFTIPREVFEAAPKLRYILSARGGVENIDLKAAHEHGVSVIHCPAHNAIAVAEYAIGLMIAESRNIARADRGLRSGTWIEKYPDSAAIPELRGSNVGIIGFGTIGRLVAERLQVFGAKILVSDPFVPAEAVTAAGCEPVSKEELLRRSDFVTLHGRIGAGDPPISGEQELRRLELEFEKLQARNDTIHDRFFDESITKADYQRAKARCESEMNRVQEKIAAIKQRQMLNTDTQTLKPDIRAAITGIVSGRTADDDFYGHLLQQMTVYRDGRVEVALNLLPAKWVYVLDGLEKYRAKIGGHDASSVPMSVSRPLSSG